MSDDDSNNEVLQITSSSYKVVSVACIILFLCLLIQIIARAEGEIKSFEIFLLALLAFFSTYFSLFIDIFLVGNNKIALSSLWKQTIYYRKIYYLKWVPIYSLKMGRTFSIYKIQYCAINGKIRSRLVSIPERNITQIDQIQRIITTDEE
jgi:hypothetical protein